MAFFFLIYENYKLKWKFIQKYISMSVIYVDVKKKECMKLIVYFEFLFFSNFFFLFFNNSNWNKKSLICFVHLFLAVTGHPPGVPRF